MFAIAPLTRKRRRIRQRIDDRSRQMAVHREAIRARSRAWMGTPQSVVQAFLAGFLLDQARPMVPDGPSPLKFLIPWIMRELG